MDGSEGHGQGGLLRRVRGGGTPLALAVDGATVRARQGDTLLVALLAVGARLRTSEFGDGPRAGFCLMGACQDCWVWTEEGARLRACTTPAREGMRIVTGAGRGLWPRPA